MEITTLMHPSGKSLTDTDQVGPLSVNVYA